MRLLRSFLPAIPFAVLAAACGGTVSGAGGSTTTGTGAGTTTSSTTTGTGPTGCPATTPATGTSCTHDGVQCTYGDSPYAECRDAVTCASGKWGPASSPHSCPSPSSECPASPPQDQSSCDADAGFLSCGYATGQICSCAPCPPIGGACMPMPLKWYCGGPPSTTGCPTLIPNEGTICATAGLMCSYPSAGCGVSVTCTGGAWTWQENPCPG